MVNNNNQILPLPLEVDKEELERHPLSVQPHHPMYADTLNAISTLGGAELKLISRVETDRVNQFTFFKVTVSTEP